jgi:hypothetical protein
MRKAAAGQRAAAGERGPGTVAASLSPAGEPAYQESSS